MDPLATTPTSIADVIAGGFGHTVDRMGARNNGLLLNAQTQSALAEAGKRRAEAVSQERINAEREALRDNIAKQGGNPTIADFLLGGFGNAEQATAGMNNIQHHGFADVVADPNNDGAHRYAAMEAASMKPVDSFYNVGSDMIADRLHGTAPAVTPIGDSRIAANKALSDQREQPKGSPTGGALSPQAGYAAAVQFNKTGIMPAFGKDAESRKMVLNFAANLLDNPDWRPEGATDALATNAAGHNDVVIDSAAAKRAMGDWTSMNGQGGKRVASLNTAVQHANAYRDAIAGLGNGDTVALNRFSNWWKTNYSGQPVPSSVAEVSQFLGPELLRAVVNSGAGSAPERIALEQNFGVNAAPAVQLGNVNTALKLLAGQAASLENEYTAGTQRKDFRERFLMPATRTAFGDKPARAAAPASIARPAASPASAPQPGASGHLTPEEQAELEQLRAHFGQGK